jgi:hypothetical protein
VDAAAFNTMLITTTDNGAITVQDGATPAAANRTTTGVVLVMSFGPNGHGAYQKRWASGRFNSSSADTDELENCDCDNTAASGTYNEVYVQKNPTTTFDDTVRYMVRWQLATPAEKGL